MIKNSLDFLLQRPVISLRETKGLALLVGTLGGLLMAQPVYLASKLPQETMPAEHSVTPATPQTPYFGTSITFPSEQPYDSTRTTQPYDVRP